MKRWFHKTVEEHFEPVPTNITVLSDAEAEERKHELHSIFNDQLNLHGWKRHPEKDETGEIDNGS